MSFFQINGTWLDVFLSNAVTFRHFLVLGVTLGSQFFILKHRLTVSRKAAGSAAFYRRLLVIKLQDVGSSALRLLYVHIQSWISADPAALIVRCRRAAGVRRADQTQNPQQTPWDGHGASRSSCPRGWKVKSCCFEALVVFLAQVSGTCAGNRCVLMMNALEASESTSFIPSFNFIHLFVHK